jgi:hypothetical protein
MKGINILALLVISLSCESPVREPGGTLPEELKFVLSPSTRSTQEGAFDAGDDIGVFAVERPGDSRPAGLTSPQYVNLQYRYNGSSFEAVGDRIMYSGRKYDFYAYSPYNASGNDISRIVHMAPTDQAGDGGWREADFCAAANTTGIASGEVPLTFYHRFATVQMKVDAAACAVSLLQVRTTASFDFSTGVATPQGGRSDIVMFREAAGSFLATLPVQVLSGTVFRITKTSGGTVEFDLTTGKSLQPGVNTVYSAGMEATVTVNPAENGYATGGGVYGIGEECTVTATPDSDYDFEGWYEGGNRVSGSRSYRFTVSGDRTLTPRFRSKTPAVTTEVGWEISVSPTSCTFAASGGSQAFTVTLNKVTKTYTNGTLTNTERVSQSSGWTGSVTGAGFSRSGDTVTASVNTSTGSRNGTFTVSYGDVSASASLSQNGKPQDAVTTEVSWEISVSPTSCTFAASGGSRAFTVTLNRVTKTYTNGTLTNTERVSQSSGWTGSATGAGFSRSGDTVTASANTSTGSRNGTFTVSYGGVSASASLSQNGKPQDAVTTEVSWEISVSPTSCTFAASGGSQAFTVTLNRVTKTYTNGTLTNTERSSQYSGWTGSVTGAGFSRSGDTVTASANTSTGSRNGTFTVSYGGVSASANLSQEGRADDGEVVIN